MPLDCPNLFTYATSELSQDAFLCWLLEWADPRHRDLDPNLHRVARIFLDALFKEAGLEAPGPDASVEVHKQLKAADIVAEIGEHHVLVIEDKTHTANRDGQLDRYRKALGKLYEDRELVCIYLKTGDQSSYRAVRSKDWGVFTRADLLDVLGKGDSVTHNVFIDFRAWLQKLEDEVNSYKKVPPKDWKKRAPAYRGFYLALQKELGQGAWSFVNNVGGGFYGFWWGSNSVEGGTAKVYLQLQEHALNVKVHVPKKDSRRAVRGRWCGIVTEKLDGFERPKRLGYGRWMTIATYEHDYRKVGDNEILDINATAKFLRGVTENLKAVVTDAEGTSAATE